MSDQTVGQCLPLYLKNRLLLSALDDDEALPLDGDEDQKLLAQFRERASEQAGSVLEELYAEFFVGNTSPIPYHFDRRSQRRTVREHWYVEGRIYRKRERIARAYWNLYLGCLRDKGPAIALVFGPWNNAAPHTFDELAVSVAPFLGIESANPRTAFTHKTDYEASVIVAYASLGAGTPYRDLSKGMKERTDAFFAKFRAPFESALDS